MQFSSDLLLVINAWLQMSPSKKMVSIIKGTHCVLIADIVMWIGLTGNCPLMFLMPKKKPTNFVGFFANYLLKKFQALRKLLILWGGRWGSNPRQQESQSWTLPTELRPPLMNIFWQTEYFNEFEIIRNSLKRDKAVISLKANLLSSNRLHSVSLQPVSVWVRWWSCCCAHWSGPVLS